MPSKEHDSVADFLSAQPVATAMLSISEQRLNYENLLKLNLIPEDVEIVENNKDNQDEVFEAIREPTIYTDLLKGNKGFFPILLILSVILIFGWF